MARMGIGNEMKKKRLVRNEKKRKEGKEVPESRTR